MIDTLTLFGTIVFAALILAWYIRNEMQGDDQGSQGVLGLSRDKTNTDHPDQSFRPADRSIGTSGHHQHSLIPPDVTVNAGQPQNKAAKSSSLLTTRVKPATYRMKKQRNFLGQTVSQHTHTERSRALSSSPSHATQGHEQRKKTDIKTTSRTKSKRRYRLRGDELNT